MKKLCAAWVAVLLMFLVGCSETSYENGTVTIGDIEISTISLGEERLSIASNEPVGEIDSAIAAEDEDDRTADASVLAE